MPDDNKPTVLKGEIIIADSTLPRMPAGTPLGLGIFGAMRFAAIERVLKQCERAILAKASVVAAEAAVNDALVARELARDRLGNLDQTRAEIAEMGHIAKLRRQLEKIALEDEIAEKEARRVKLRGDSDKDQSGGVANDEFATFMDTLRRMPDIVKEAANAKAQVIADAGGEDKLDDAQRQMCAMFDSMTQSFMSKKAGDAAL